MGCLETKTLGIVFPLSWNVPFGDVDIPKRKIQKRTTDPQKKNPKRNHSMELFMNMNPFKLQLDDLSIL